MTARAGCGQDAGCRSSASIATGCLPHARLNSDTRSQAMRRLIPIFVDCVVEKLEDRVRVGDCAGALRSARVLAREDRVRSQALVDAGHDGAPLLASVLSGPA